MLKRHTFWLWTAVALLLVTTLAHTSSLFVTPAPANDTERQLLDLMANYKSDLGGGFHRSMTQIVTALSACFSLVCLLGALTLGYLARKQADLALLKGVAGIHALVFGIVFALMAAFTFWPPIILTGLIFGCLTATWLLLPKRAT
jgi:hypothetical protein